MCLAHDTKNHSTSHCAHKPSFTMCRRVGTHGRVPGTRGQQCAKNATIHHNRARFCCQLLHPHFRLPSPNTSKTCSSTISVRHHTSIQTPLAVTREGRRLQAAKLLSLHLTSSLHVANPRPVHEHHPCAHVGPIASTRVGTRKRCHNLDTAWLLLLPSRPRCRHTQQK